MRVLCFEIRYVGWVPKVLKNYKVRKEVLNTWLETKSKLHAVKRHRELVGSSLRKAVEYCDNLQEEVDKKCQ